MKHTFTRYGLIGGLIMVVLGWINFYVTKSMGYQAAEIGGYLSILIGLTMIYFGIRHQRDLKNDGTISFTRAFRLGMAITLIPSVLMFFNAILFFTFKGEEWIAWAMEYMSPEQVQQYEEAPEWMLSPVFQGVVMFGTVLILGLIISLVSALILKRE